MQRPTGASPPRHGKRERSRSPDGFSWLDSSKTRQPPPPDSRYQQREPYGRRVGPGGTDTRQRGPFQQPQQWRDPQEPPQHRPYPARGAPWGRHDPPQPGRDHHPPWSHNSSSRSDSRQAYLDSYSSAPGRRREPPQSSSRQRPRSRSPPLRRRRDSRSPSSHCRSPRQRHSSSRSPGSRHRSHSRSPAHRPAPGSPQGQRRSRSPDDNRRHPSWQRPQQRPRSSSPGRSRNSPRTKHEPGQPQQQRQQQQQPSEPRCLLPGLVDYAGSDSEPESPMPPSQQQQEQEQHKEQQRQHRSPRRAAPRAAAPSAQPAAADGEKWPTPPSPAAAAAAAPVAPVGPAESSADIVRRMMQAPTGGSKAPGLAAAGAPSSMTRQQKVALLWGRKKDAAAAGVAPAAGANAWDAAEFDRREDATKFQRLMGVKAAAAAAAAAEAAAGGVASRLPAAVAAPAAGSAAPAGDPLLEGHTVMSRTQQARVLQDVEQQFVAGLRRADGRTVGLGL